MNKPPRSTSSSPGHLGVDGPRRDPRSFSLPRQRLPRALGVSALSHAAFIVIALIAIRYAPETAAQPDIAPAFDSSSVVWLSSPGPGGGGGGGGNRSPEPPRRVERPGSDAVSLPVAEPRPAVPQPEAAPADDVQPPALLLAAKPMGSSQATLPGVIDGLPTGTSQGPGRDGIGGSGLAGGIGPGTGTGLGPGLDRGSGGGLPGPGSGVIEPQPIRQVKPEYTADAMRAKIRGVVLLEAIVETNGTLRDIRVVGSLDPVFGLDQEAIKAARQWRFIPATLRGKPVPMAIRIEMEFNLS